MEEEVVIFKIDKNKIYVKQSGDTCSMCKSNLFCKNKEREYTVLNKDNLILKEGDNVIVEIKEGRATLSVLITLLFPVLMFFPGYFIGKAITNNELFVALIGLGFVAFGFLLSFLFFHLYNRKFTPTLKRKIEVDE